MDYPTIISQRARERSIELSELKQEYKTLEESLARVRKLMNNNIAKTLKLQGGLAELANLEYIQKESHKKKPKKAKQAKKAK